MVARLIEVELRVRDLDRSLRFYRDLLGLPVGDPEVHDGGRVRHAHATWGSWAHGAEGFLLFNLCPAEAGEVTHASVGFMVDDLDAAHARLERAGAAVVRPPETRPWGRTAVYRDPDGNTISLMQQPGTASS